MFRHAPSQPHCHSWKICHTKNKRSLFQKQLTELHGSTVFSKIELKEGQHQIQLHKASRNITAFAIHDGIFRFKQLVYKIKSLFAYFQKQIK